jgi:phosphoribosylglycinamide formyltransferase 1
VLASGGGSNLVALLAHLDANPAANARVTLVASERPGAGALEKARARGIAAALIATRPGAPGTTLDELLDPAAVDLVVLAGYLRLVPAEVVARFHGRILNVHPALLPSFGGPGMYGQRVHAAVIDAGARVSGATVHFVDEQYDRGAIIAQWPVPVLPGDTAQSLAARVLRAEHELLPRAVVAIATGRIALGADGRVAARSGPGFDDAPGEPAFTIAGSAELAHSMDRLLPP